MHSKKEYEAKIRKLERRIAKLEREKKRYKKQLSDLRKTLKYLKQRVKELVEGRTKWKEKYKANQLTIKSLKRQLCRKGKAKRHFYPLALIQLCVLFRVVGKCSYEGVTHLLKILSFCKLIDFPRLPCENTIQNWVAKVGLHELQRTANQLVGKEVVLLVDESIRIGRDKQLLVLSTPFEKSKKEALCFEDVQVLYFGGRTSWTGESISKILEDLETQNGYKVRALLSDEASTLKKTARLSNYVHLPDISHAVGTCLRKTFEHCADYQRFTKLLSAFKSKGVNQEVTYLLPPNQGTKVRFMNLVRPVKWAIKMLRRMKNLKDTERHFFEELAELRPIINRLAFCMSWSTYFSTILKKNGLSKSTLKKARKKLAALRKQKGETLVVYFLNLLDKYLSDYQEFINTTDKENIPVSSEIIESLFGKYKQIASKNKLTVTTRLNLQIPVECMTMEAIMKQTQNALETIFISDLDTWTQEHSSDNQIVKRRKFFSN